SSFRLSLESCQSCSQARNLRVEDQQSQQRDERAVRRPRLDLKPMTSPLGTTLCHAVSHPSSTWTALSSTLIAASLSQTPGYERLVGRSAVALDGMVTWRRDSEPISSKDKRAYCHTVFMIKFWFTDISNYAIPNTSFGEGGHNVNRVPTFCTWS